MNEEQIKLLNEKCKYIVFDGYSDFDITGSSLYIKDIDSFKIVLENLKDKSKIEIIDLGKEQISLDFFKDFHSLFLIKSEGNLDLETLYKIYEYFPLIDTIRFKTVDENVLEVCDMFKFKIETEDPRYQLPEGNNYFLYQNKLSIKRIESLFLDFPYNEKYVDELSKYCKEIGIISFRDVTLEDQLLVINRLLNNGVKINEVYINLEDEDYKKTKILNELKNKVGKIYVSFEGELMILDDYLEVKATLKYYLDLIKSQKLSPIEQLMYAYDLVKSFNYRANKERPMDSRSLSGIVKTGDIVCFGYSIFLKQIVKELGIKIEKTSILAKQNKVVKSLDEIVYIMPPKHDHARNIVMIDDDKYNIHGVFALDVTYDSNEEKETGLSRYLYFLIPVIDYHKVFPYDSYPILFSYYLYGNNKKPKDYVKNYLTNEDDELLEQFKLFFDGEYNSDKYKKYMRAKRLNSEQFKEMLRNVRRAEGYSEELIEEEVEKVSKLNGYESSESIKKKTFPLKIFKMW